MLAVKIKDSSILPLVRANSGYCPCAIEKTDDMECMCREFREQRTPGPCHCGLYEKVEVDEHGE